MDLSFNSVLAQEGTNLAARAAQKIQARLEQNPNDVDLMRKLGDLQRQAGQIEVSAQTFSQLAQLEDAHEKDAYLSQVLAGEFREKPLSFPSMEFMPAPFVRESNFLSEEELDLVWNQCDLKIKEATCSFVGPIEDSVVDYDARRSKSIGGGLLGKDLDFFLDRISPLIFEAYQWFEIQPPRKSYLEMELTSHSDGEHYAIHCDSGEGYNRRLSYIYYFHQLPRKFSGGQLHLYDTDTKRNRYTESFTSIDPTHNSLIIFPSEYFHQVCRVSLDSNLRREGRFTLNGWHQELVDAE